MEVSALTITAQSLSDIQADSERVEQVKAFQRMGFWVIALRSPLPRGGYKHKVLEAHSNVTNADTRHDYLIKYFWNTGYRSVEVILLEPFWKVWGMQVDTEGIEAIGLFPSKAIAEQFCAAVDGSLYNALWITLASESINEDTAYNAD